VIFIISDEAICTAIIVFDGSSNGGEK
jgi:hypothetical protein